MKKENGNKNIRIKKRTNDKDYVMKKTEQMNALRLLLWCMLIFIFVRGVITCLRPDKTSEIERLIDEFRTEFYDTQDLDYEMLAFAQNFTYEYLTYDVNDKETFISRIKPYASEKVMNIENIYDFKNKCEAVYAGAYKIESTSSNQADVFVKATVKYSMQELQADTGTYKTISRIKNVILRVPIHIAPGGYIVEDLPVYVNDGMIDPNYEYTQGYSGEEVDSDDYKEPVINFLKAYYGNDQSVLDYFISSDADISKFYCLNGSYEFTKLNSLAAYKNKEGIFCIVVYQITDAINGTLLTQSLNMEFVSSGKRLYVKDLNTKTVNLEEE